MLTSILSILTSSGLGAIVGLLGSWLTKREERENLKLKYHYDVKMAEIRKSEAELEFKHELAMADKEIERAQTEGQIARDIEELGAFKESIKEQQKLYKIPIVDAIRGLMRPVITIYLLIIATVVVVKIGGYIGGLESMEKSHLVPLFEDTISKVLFLTTTAVTWWFGSRPTQQRK